MSFPAQLSDLDQITPLRCALFPRLCQMFTLYMKQDCPYSENARKLLTHFGYVFKLYYPTKDELRQITGLPNPTYPQVYDGTTRLGGYDDLQKYLGLARQRGARWKPPTAR